MKDARPDHWDPRPHEREWYSHRDTGERGYLVRRDGLDVIRENKTQYEVIHKLDHNWKEDKGHRPLNMAQLARVAFIADRELCKAIGLHDVARREWEFLSEADRSEWIRGKGPKKPQLRADLFEAVWGCLKGSAR